MTHLTASWPDLPIDPRIRPELESPVVKPTNREKQFEQC